MTDTIELDEDTRLALVSARARRALIDAPELVAHIRTLVVPLLGGASDGMPRAASKEAPAPARLDAIDEADMLYSQLIRWVVFWSGQFNRPLPVPAAAAYAREGQWITDVDALGDLRVPHTALGIGATVTPPGARNLTEMLTTWLLADHDVIADEPSGPAYFEDVADFLWRARSKFPRAPRPSRGVIPRPCPLCEHFALGAEWRSDDVADFELRCSFCGDTEDASDVIRAGRVRELLADLREERGRDRVEWWTKRQASLEMGITVRTIDRYVQAGLPTMTHDGNVWVRVDDLQGMYRAKRIAQRESRRAAIIDKAKATWAPREDDDTPDSA